MNADFKKQKQFIIKELAKLENLNWAQNSEVASSIFPYVLVEAINLLFNSEIIEEPVDLTSTGTKAKKLIETILKHK